MQNSSIKLLVRAGTLTCALPISHVVEVMRPLPVMPLEHTQEFVLGVSIIRGIPVPVIDLARLIGGATADHPHTRFVTVHVSDRCFALAVTAVVAVREVSSFVAELTPLLNARSAALEGLTVLDSELLLVLTACDIVDSEIWDEVTNRRQAL